MYIHLHGVFEAGHILYAVMHSMSLIFWYFEKPFRLQPGTFLIF